MVELAILEINFPESKLQVKCKESKKPENKSTQNDCDFIQKTYTRYSGHLDLSIHQLETKKTDLQYPHCSNDSSRPENHFLILSFTAILDVKSQRLRVASILAGQCWRI
jgi:hypothetical protein